MTDRPALSAFLTFHSSECADVVKVPGGRGAVAEDRSSAGAANANIKKPTATCTKLQDILPPESPDSQRRIPSRKPLQVCFSCAGSTGSLRSRLPVAAKIALVTAGTMQAVPASPIPPGGSALGTM